MMNKNAPNLIVNCFFSLHNAFFGAGANVPITLTSFSLSIVFFFTPLLLALKEANALFLFYAKVSSPSFSNLGNALKLAQLLAAQALKQVMLGLGACSLTF